MPEQYSTRAAYKSLIKNQIKPRWALTPLSAIKSMAVEDWLRSLDLAPKTRSHVKSLMHTIFQCAERWELTDKNPIKLVRVEADGSPRFLYLSAGLEKLQGLKASVVLRDAGVLHRQIAT